MKKEELGAADSNLDRVYCDDENRWFSFQADTEGDGPAYTDGVDLVAGNGGRWVAEGPVGSSPAPADSRPDVAPDPFPSPEPAPAPSFSTRGRVGRK